MEIAYNSTNPYNFTFAFHWSEKITTEEFLTAPYDPYETRGYHFFRLVFAYLKNVRFRSETQREIIQRLSNVTGEKMIKIKRKKQFDLVFEAIQHGVIDSVHVYFAILRDDPKMVHVSPISHRNSDVILSSVSSGARRESSETLSFQGLSTLVWVLFGCSLLVVSGLVTYFSFETEKKNGRERPLNSWMNNVWIYAADIVNNCVAGVIRTGPGRQLRSWWLLGVVFLIQFWSAGMKSDLLADKTSFIDSIEDLMSKPELICVMSKNYANKTTFGTSEDDPRFKDYRKKKIRYVDEIFDKKWRGIVANGSGVIFNQEITVLTFFVFRVENLNEAERKLYVGKKKYGERYSYTIFNKRLPRAIKEDIDYAISRLFETRQAEPRLRRDNLRAREFVFDPTTSTMSWSAQNVAFLSPVFRLWIIGMSLATFAFCVEFYQLRRRTVKVSPHHSMGIWIRA